MNRLQILLDAYLNNTASDSEVAEMLLLLRNEPNAEVEQLLASEFKDRQVANNNPIDWEAMWATIAAEMASDKIQQPVRPHFPIIKRWLLAATIIGVMLTGGYWLYYKNIGNGALTSKQVVVKHDRPAGTTGAILTLPDGKTIVLDTASNGLLAMSNNASISKGSNGIAIAGHNGDVTEYATIETPMGRIQNITLSDGTRIWLNAGSSIRFPTTFPQNERSVSITGEVYFEVAENTASPFRVNVGETIVEVLGTHFNINAYHDEKAIKTTLLQGSVKIKNGNATAVLKPNQLATYVPNTIGIAIKDDPTPDNAISWVNGFFHFEKADIHTVMRQIARWYDVEITYLGKPTTDRFGGDIQRNLPLSGILKTLERSQVHFKIENHKLIVMP